MGLIANQSFSVAGLWMQLGVTMAILGLTAGLAWLTVRFFRNGRSLDNDEKRMTITSKLPLSAKKCVYLVRVDDRELILGVSENSMVLLGETGKTAEAARTDG